MKTNRNREGFRLLKIQTHIFGHEPVVMAVEEKGIENGNVCRIPHGGQVGLADLKSLWILLQ